MKLSNCLFWAVGTYIGRRRQGKHGYVAMRKSYWGMFPHFLYIEDGRIFSYVPRSPKHRVLPPPLFRGRIRCGDAVPKTESKA